MSQMLSDFTDIVFFFFFNLSTLEGFDVLKQLQYKVILCKLKEIV